MDEDDFDPIRIDISEAFDARFAKFGFVSDNSPRAPDGSINLTGSVAFGGRRVKGSVDRYYNIGIKFAYLDIKETNCVFDRNMKLEEIVQKGMLKESLAERSQRERSAKVGGDASLRAGSTGAKPNAGLTASGKFGAENSIDQRSEIQHESYRVRWVARGCQFGERKYGNPYDPDGILEGVFLNGIWGRLLPNRHALQYGAQITLVIPKGKLSVTPEAWSIRDIIPTSNRDQQDDAFNALKSAVAGWAVEGSLAAHCHPEGYDSDAGELVLAAGVVAVDLRKFEQIAASGPDARLPASASIPEIAPPVPTEANTPAKPSPRPRKARSK